MIISCFTSLSIQQVNTPRICARLIWAITEHINLEGLDPLLGDDPEDPLDIIISNIHKVLFNVDSSSNTSNRFQDFQAFLLSAQRLRSRNPRAVSKELEELRNNGLADSVNKHQFRLIVQRIKYVQNHPDSRCSNALHHCDEMGLGEIHAVTASFCLRLAVVRKARGDYPCSHYKLTVQFYEAAAAQDRKLEGLVHRAILELWRPDPSELTILLAKGIDSPLLKLQPPAYT
ncbi:hypothetical protein SADUNF_Sadunf17G0064200 [Salix dunnii]|uniref:Uncharacterized protein n=1 Tax=Salix dunnii TaxID=1413687 RepID=A0A835MJU6_9ROSI|nr:hypothetical protein SADUNF_Sadunf17G0064200 [Salix dunnii]